MGPMAGRRRSYGGSHAAVSAHYAPAAHYAGAVHGYPAAYHGGAYGGRGGYGYGYGGHNYGWHGYSTGAYWRGGYWHGGYWPRAYYGLGFAWFLPVLPLAYATYWYGGIPYYYANDVYYTYNPSYDGYVATDPPPVADSGAAPATGAGEAPDTGARAPGAGAGSTASAERGSRVRSWRRVRSSCTRRTARPLSSRPPTRPNARNGPPNRPGRLRRMPRITSAPWWRASRAAVTAHAEVDKQEVAQLTRLAVLARVPCRLA